MRRLLTALILIPIALWAILWAPAAAFYAVVAAFAVACFHEYANLSAAGGIEVFRILGFILGGALLWNPEWLRWMAVPVLTASLATGDLRRSLPQAASTLLGIAYVFGAWSCAPQLRAISPYWVLFAIVINWFGDSAAYYTGRAFGRHKLAPTISPGKSVEGAIGSLAASVVFGLLVRHWLLPAVGVQHMVILSLGANIAGQIGDLAESALKRGAGVKDSGTMLPGHGGWLDRLDSTLFSMPAVTWMLALTRDLR